ncbi:hypothetical protein KMW28_27000 [Flammeovirga yaeyamensis]|uniref:Uncharacterized protein n=1 Tax=Flammeovirga yaeyamensis TaxID=367791 RepID=A0AAX1NED3_9BACT|nr:hypothetical protein [Flammeovirga yaeyamensis]MBB3700075.1 DNA gyrase/topoisomerase IV subunit A [Flammeovirga yaeyamensis]NMF37491.1 hypothetical protein [Flammeovirga yaeyamensis]QWG04548.1 hypothetical protein KMW28_27000 [Flammeovirga yaeyamensis]
MSKIEVIETEEVVSGNPIEHYQSVEEISDDIEILKRRLQQLKSTEIKQLEHELRKLRLAKTTFEAKLEMEKSAIDTRGELNDFEKNLIAFQLKFHENAQNEIDKEFYEEDHVPSTRVEDMIENGQMKWYNSGYVKAGQKALESGEITDMDMFRTRRELSDEVLDEYESIRDGGIKRSTDTKCIRDASEFPKYANNQHDIGATKCIPDASDMLKIVDSHRPYGNCVDVHELFAYTRTDAQINRLKSKSNGKAWRTNLSKWKKQRGRLLTKGASYEHGGVPYVCLENAIALIDDTKKFTGENLQRAKILRNVLQQLLDKRDGKVTD